MHRPHGSRRGVASWREGQNFSVAFDDNKGTWYDHKEHEGGGIVDLVARITGRDRAGSLRWLAEYCGENVRKGKRVLVEGRITNRSYDDKDGVKKYISEIEASTIMTMERSAAAGGNAPSQGGSNYRPENNSRASSSQYSSGPAPVPDYEPQQSGPVDDLPF